MRVCSGQHAALCVDVAGRLWLVDLGSGKGTFVLPAAGAPVRVPAGEAREVAAGGAFFLEDPRAAQVVFRVEAQAGPGDGGALGGAPTRGRGGEEEEDGRAESAVRADDREEGEEAGEVYGVEDGTAAGERRRSKKKVC